MVVLRNRRPPRMHPGCTDPLLLNGSNLKWPYFLQNQFEIHRALALLDYPSSWYGVKQPFQNGKILWNHVISKSPFSIYFCRYFIKSPHVPVEPILQVVFISVIVTSLVQWPVLTAHYGESPYKTRSYGEILNLYGGGTSNSIFTTGITVAQRY
jgi:hypothetical protein